MPPKKGTEAYDKWRNSDKYKIWVDSRTGKNSSLYGKKRPDLSEINRQKIGEKNHMFGRTGERNPAYNKRYAKYNINEEFFDKQTPESLWVLGFIFADGSMDKRGYSIALTQKEPEILEKINILMESNYPIRKRHNAGWSNGDICRLRMTSKKLYIALEKYGLHPNKSLDIKFPELDKSIVSHFIRGYFDGDGSIYVATSKSKGKEYPSLRVKMVGSKKLISKMKSIIFNLYRIEGSASFPGRVEEVRYSTKKAGKLMDIIYKGSNEEIRLNRKYKIFQNWRQR